MVRCHRQPREDIMTASSKVSLRPAVRSDSKNIHRFVLELAEYQKLAHEVESKQEDIERNLFCKEPRIFCTFAEVSAEPIGFALWYYTHSSFAGRHGLFLEDLYVVKDWRSHGVGKKLFAHLAQKVRDEHLTAIEWSVLTWNTRAIALYIQLGAVTVSKADDHIRFRLKGEKLLALTT